MCGANHNGWCGRIAGLETKGNIKAGKGLQIGSDGAACSESTAGTLRFNSETQQFEACAGEDWSSLIVRPITNFGSGKDGDLEVADTQVLEDSSMAAYLVVTATKSSVVTSNPPSMIEIGDRVLIMVMQASKSMALIQNSVRMH